MIVIVNATQDIIKNSPEYMPPRSWGKGIRIVMAVVIRKKNKPNMLIQINTDNNIEGSERLSRYFSGVIESTLNRFTEHITRVEVHLSDENGQKEGPNDKRCMLEVRVKGLQPIAVTHKAESLDLAVNGAAAKTKNTLETTIGKFRTH